MTTFTATSPQTAAAHPSGTLEFVSQAIRTWARNQRLKSRLAQERRQLAVMSDAMLEDIGITRAEAYAEAARFDIPPFRLDNPDWR